MPDGKQHSVLRAAAALKCLKYAAAVFFSIFWLPAAPLYADGNGKGNGKGNGEPSIRAAFDRLGEARTLSASFVQTRRIPHMRMPLRIRGGFYLDRAGRFAWRVKEPVKYNCVIVGERLAQWDSDSDKTVRIDLAGHPALSGMLRFMKMFFSGNTADAAAFFKIEKKGADELVLVPKEGTQTASVVASVSLGLSADGRYAERIRVREKNGDETLIVFSGVTVNGKIDEKIWDINFR